MGVSKLRFPEFRGGREWRMEKLGNICDVVGGGTPDTRNSDYWNGDILWLTPSEIGQTKYIDSSKRNITELGLKNSSAQLLPVGTILLTSRATLGEMGILAKQASTNQGFQSLIPKKGINGIYVYYLQEVIKKLCIKYAKGSTFLEVSSTSVKNFLIPYPSLENEQQKIADCLSSIDDLIISTVKKIEALKAHKKGLMQQLFPAEGKKVPAMRFPEFREAGEWKEKTIHAIGEVVTGNTPSKNKKEFWGGNFVWITAQDFKDKYIYDSVLKLTEKGRKKSKVIPQNSILVTCIASIGLNGINKIECATNQQINSVICYPDYDYEFVYYTISYNSDRLKSFAGQTAVPIISKSVFENFVILIPEQKKEQQKIAGCLSSLDDLITALTQKLEALKNHKKGLMQQLFPDMNE